jgi:Cd2+/Zn2+-exporting ATPase
MKVKKAPYVFDEFFASGKEESISPFLTPNSRSWGKNLSLKSALFSALLLVIAYAASFSIPPLKTLPLLFVYVLCGTPALLHALEDIKKLNINIDILMTLAALLSALLGSPLEGALLLVLFELSAAMEESVAHKTKGTLAHLQELSSRTAYVIEEEEIIQRSIREVLPGMKLLIKAGEIVPLDSKVIAGQSSIHLKHLTGESEPFAKTIGDEIPGGARNLDGTLTVEVVRSSADSTLARIIQLITSAQSAKPKLEKFLDRFGTWYAMGIMSLCFLFALSLPWFFELPYLGKEGSIYRALAFLIAASPCALIIATPTAYLCAINSCAKRGILLKGGVVLDALTSCKTVAFDKTGTLTTGELVCHEILPLHAHKTSIDKALQIASSLESGSTHPIAAAICELARKKKLVSLAMQEFRSIAGFGLEAIIENKATAIGNPAFIEKKLVLNLMSRWPELKKNWEGKEAISALLLIEDELFLLLFKDEIRSSSKECIESLKKDKNLKLLMLSGDKKSNALHIAKQLGIEQVAYELKPEDKLEKVSELSKEGGLIMVGDGINDAPALARATVGIALGKVGSATAVDASDVVLMNDDLLSLQWLLQKARQTLAIVKQNLTLALGVICFATTPALLGFIPLWLAVILHEGGTVLVGLNSLRLLRSKRN